MPNELSPVAGLDENIIIAKRSSARTSTFSVTNNSRRTDGDSRLFPLLCNFSQPERRGGYRIARGRCFKGVHGLQAASKRDALVHQPDSGVMAFTCTCQGIAVLVVGPVAISSSAA